MSTFSCAERAVARDVSTNATDIANDNDIDAGPYLEAVARIVLMGDLSDRMMASLGRELLQRYERDVRALVIATDVEIDAEITRLEGLLRQRRAMTPNVILFNGTGVTV